MVNKRSSKCVQKTKHCIKVFLKNITTEKEQRYKKYKNKLINIKRFCEKQYYSNLLENNKSNIKETWKILKTILNKNAKKSLYLQCFNDNDGNPIKDEHIAANKFNDFFVNIGPTLASKIKQENECSIFDYMEHANKRCMFLEPVDDQEVLTLIKQCKNKTSEDYNNISMNTVKNIAETVLQPFSFICNLSFSTGSVPNKMKIAKIIPLYKSGNKSLFNNYRPVALLPQFSKMS